MRVVVAPSVDAQIAEEARFWRTSASREIAERLVRDIRRVINTLATGQIGSKVEGLRANFKRVMASKHPPFYIYYYIDEELEEVFVFLLRHASQRPLKANQIRELAEQAREKDADNESQT